MATHYSILVWKIPQTGEPGGLQPMGSKRGRHNLVTKQNKQVTIKEKQGQRVSIKGRLDMGVDGAWLTQPAV